MSTWKRNFRSALNRKEVLRLADDKSKDPFDPHKVYEFVTPGVWPGWLGESQTPCDQEDLCPSFYSPSLWTAARDFVHLDTSPDTNGKSSLSDPQVRRQPSCAHPCPVPGRSPLPPTPSFCPWTSILYQSATLLIQLRLLTRLAALSSSRKTSWDHWVAWSWNPSQMRGPWAWLLLLITFNHC